MEQPEEHKADIKRKFARRRRSQIMIAVPLIAMMILLALSDGKEGVLGVSLDVVARTGIVLILAALAFSIFNWRCPACNRYLGKTISPKFCSKCGVELS